MSVLDPQRRRRSTLILLVLTSITLLSLDYQGFRTLGAVQSVVRSVVDPVAGGADSVTTPITNAWKSFTDFEEMEEDNARLREEVAQLRAAVIETSAADETLRELLDEIDLDYVGGAETAVARVVERPGNFQSYTVEIDRGSEDGLSVGMPVVSSDGLVGRVVSVDPRFSQVRLLHQPESRLGVRFIGAGEIALASGMGRGQDLEVTEGLDEDTEIEVGAPVVTSGIEGSSYPPDIAVGFVSEVVFDRASLKLLVRIRPVAELEDLRFVTVILWTVDGESES